MEIVKRMSVPTGDICIAKGEKGLLEFLSIGDYGKEKNLKADFLGLPNEINGVPHGDLLPLSEKWVVTVSSQYGCSMNCSFCDVPKVGKGINVTEDDIYNQVITAKTLHPEIRHTDRLNVHYARMGEPTFNPNVISATLKLHNLFHYWQWGFHPVVSTMCPLNNTNLDAYLKMWMMVKNTICKGEAGLQLSINSTDEKWRIENMPFALSLFDISKIVKAFAVVGRKIALNFALTDAPIDENLIAELFPSDRFLCKITPMHNTSACAVNNLVTENGYVSYYPYQDAESRLKSVGFDVIVFIPSIEEDQSKITCGNAILSEIK